MTHRHLIQPSAVLALLAGAAPDPYAGTNLWIRTAPTIGGADEPPVVAQPCVTPRGALALMIVPKLYRRGRSADDLDRDPSSWDDTDWDDDWGKEPNAYDVEWANRLILASCLSADVEDGEIAIDPRELGEEAQLYPGHAGRVHRTLTTRLVEAGVVHPPHRTTWNDDTELDVVRLTPLGLGLVIPSEHIQHENAAARPVTAELVDTLPEELLEPIAVMLQRHRPFTLAFTVVGG